MIFENYFNDILKLNPTFATFVGINKYNSLLENTLSDKYLEEYKEIIEKYLTKLKEIKKKNIYHKALKYELKIIK